MIVKKHILIKRQWLFLCLVVFPVITAFIQTQHEVCACTGNVIKQEKSQKTGVMNGLVMDKSGGVPVKKAIVCLKQDKTIIARTKTNGKGSFTFTHVNSGNYTLCVCSENQPEVIIGGVLIHPEKPFYLNVFLHE